MFKKTVNTIKNRFSNAVMNENGDMGIQQLVLIAVALAIAAGVILFGNTIVDSIAGRQTELENLDKGKINL